MGILFLLVNLIVSAIFGTWIKHTKQPKWTFLILPLSFLLLILVRYPKHIYVYLFLLLYLLVEYLAFLLADSKK
ncbi:hypothetical protein [Bombilactobacillus thymidiniphilus]|uniref:Uncharacterized protein n=1 Tax=Bombilactobacillus thymidiniphilus TaxID=2923363 RepID=A0ABY4PDA0_9LACO|nr:hypothetical protein [Bombilactobacillus thymidiniphilus]UQS83529.1 hypothetical protein MOO47_07100 [Bombilactobacillus thymidiniphilus]